MSITQYLLIGFAIMLVGFFCIQLLDMSQQRRVTRCVDALGEFVCPKCHKPLGAAAKSSARQRGIKFTSGGWRRLRGRDYPSWLVTTDCPHCSAELDFRLDGSLFSCNHEVIA